MFYSVQQGSRYIFISDQSLILVHYLIDYKSLLPILIFIKVSSHDLENKMAFFLAAGVGIASAVVSTLK